MRTHPQSRYLKHSTLTVNTRADFSGSGAPAQLSGVPERRKPAGFTGGLTTGEITGPGGLVARYDFGAETSEGRRFLGHNGGAPGMNGELRVFPDDGYTVVVLANRDPPVADALANFISDRLP
jgi:hypothetical protein